MDENIVRVPGPSSSSIAVDDVVLDFIVGNPESTDIIVGNPDESTPTGTLPFSISDKIVSALPIIS